MNLRTRIEKLERASTPEERRVTFEKDASGQFVGAGLFGTGTFKRRHDEEEGAFLCRVYGTQVSKKPAMEMSDYQLLVIVAASDAPAAMELADTGTISDRTLEAQL